jgi:hypothetical protein
LAHALATTHDGIVPYRDPEKLPRNSPKPPKDLAYLTEGRRTQLIVSAMSGLFQVEPIPGADPASASTGAAVKAGGTEICRIKRPIPDVFKAQLEFVHNYADLRLDRMAEILAQDFDILAFFAAILPAAAPNRKATFELMTTLQTLCIGLEMQAKHYCWAARPVEFSADVQPVIPTPDHSTFPSGHATEAFAIATLLTRLTSRRDSAQGIAEWSAPFRLAHRIAVNRTVAGVHFPIDSAAGAMLGCAIGDAFCDILSGSPLRIRTFDGAKPFSDFLTTWLKAQPTPDLAAEPAAATPATTPEIAKAHWAAAAAEWEGNVP